MPQSRRLKEDCKMQRTEEKGSVTKRFDSFAEFLDHVSETTFEPGTSHIRNGEHGYTDWHGSESFADAMNLARNGWREGLAMIESLTARLESVTGSLVQNQVVQWDVAGDFADAGLFSAGVPECMGSFHEEIAQGPGKVVRILYNIAASGGADCATLMKRGAAVVALVDALEGAGRSCEIEIASVQENMSGARYTVLLPVKSAGEPVELDRLAFILAHASSYRRLMFACFENETPEVRSRYKFHIQKGYGTPERHKDESADVNVPEISLFNSANDAQALAWIRAELQRQGCTMEETPA